MINMGRENLDVITFTLYLKALVCGAATNFLRWITL